MKPSRPSPITFNVEKGDVAETQASTSQLVMPDRKSVKNLGEDIRFIRTRQPSYKFRTVFFVDSLWYWVTAALILLVAGLLWYLMKGMEARRADVVGNKNRKATKMALGRLKMAAGYLQKNLYSAFYEELHKALLGFASDKMNIGAEDLSKEKYSGNVEGGRSRRGTFRAVRGSSGRLRVRPLLSGRRQRGHEYSLQ